MSSLRERLVRFYRFYNPACLNSIDSILEIYQGSEEDIFQVLEEKYGPEPPPTPQQRPRESSPRTRPVPELTTSYADRGSAVDAANGGEKDRLIRALSAALREKSRETKQLLEKLHQSDGTAPSQHDAGELRRLNNLLESEREENYRLRTAGARAANELTQSIAECGRLREKVGAAESANDSLRKVITQLNDNELLLLRELGALKLQLGEEAPSKNSEIEVSQIEQRYQKHFDRQVEMISQEMQSFYESAKTEVSSKEQLIEILEKRLSESY